MSREIFYDAAACDMSSNKARGQHHSVVVSSSLIKATERSWEQECTKLQERIEGYRKKIEPKTETMQQLQEEIEAVQGEIKEKSKVMSEFVMRKLTPLENKLVQERMKIKQNLTKLRFEVAEAAQAKKMAKVKTLNAKVCEAGWPQS